MAFRPASQTKGTMSTVQAPPKPATFVSRSPNQRITIENSSRIVMDINNRMVKPNSTGKHVQFEKSYFVANEESAAAIGLPLEELLDFLRSHENFNLNRPGGFWEEGAAPDEPQPTLADQMKAIGRAAAAGDINALEQVRQTELETHNRVAVLQGVDEAEETLREILDTAAKAEADDAGQAPAGEEDSE